MKLLSIGRPKEALLSLSPEKNQQLMKTALEQAKQLKEKGKVLAQYSSPTSGYIFTILEYNNAEEWMKDIQSIEALRYID